MSQRGSFITEHIFCKRCYDACYRVLVKKVDGLRGIKIPNSYVIAGTIRDTYSELYEFDENLIPEIQSLMCPDHTLKIYVASEGKEIHTFIFNSQDILSEIIHY